MALQSDDSSDETSQDQDDKKILEEALSRFKMTEEAENANRIAGIEDLEFLDGKQWHDEDLNSRKMDGRPSLTINKLPQVINQVTNDQRQNRPAIKAHPVDENSDIETAKILQGMIRNIEYLSNAEAAYDTAFEFAAKIGWGYWRVITQYASPTSFDQEILIKRIPNPFSVFFDPHSIEPDGSDANFAFITEDMSKDEYLDRYPDSELAKSGEWETYGNEMPEWVKADTARVTEYFYKTNQRETLCLLNTGDIKLKSELPEMLPEGVQIVKEREASIPKVKWVKLNGCEILEQTEWPGMHIPIVPTYGTETNINGKRTLKGIVRDAKDPARMYNYFASAESEAIALAPKAPFIADPKSIEGYEHIWETANRKNHSYLPYNMIINGQVLPPPQRSSSDISTQAITQARMLASDDIKATTGIYDAALGAKSNETSGIAIQRRNNQAQTSNFHFTDNLTRSLRHTGRILIELIPIIYDTEQSARIIGEDGEQKVVRINAQQPPEGQDHLYKLDAGKYDVTIDVGPSFQTKRQEASQNMIELSRSIPSLGQAAPDLIVKSFDFDGAQELSERLKKTLPPGLADDGKDQKQEIPPQVKQQMDQMGKMVEQLTTKLHEAHDKIDDKSIELESKERIEFKKLEVQLQIAMAQIDAKDSIALLNHEIDSIHKRMSVLREDAAFDIQSQQQNLDQAQAMGQEPPMQQPPMQPMPDNQSPTGGISPGQSMEGQQP